MGIPIEIVIREDLDVEPAKFHNCNEMSRLVILCVILAAIVCVNGFYGDLTYYYEWRGNFGSCGLERSKYDQFYVAALSRERMKLPPSITNPNKHPLCAANRCIKVTGRRGSVVLKISDTCWACSYDDIDVADSVFPLLDDPAKGRVKVSWEFTDCSRLGKV